MATGIKEGVAVGAYSNIACFNPSGAAAWYRLMLEDIEEALLIEKEIAVFLKPVYSLLRKQDIQIRRWTNYWHLPADGAR